MSPCAQTNSIREALERLRPDAHSCLIYQTPEEQFAATVPLMELGLKRGEKCIYLCDETRTGQLLEAMRAYGIDTDAAIQSGALTVMYERQVASFFTGKKLLDVALYDRDCVSPQVLLNVIRSHPVVIWDGTVCDNLHAAAPDDRLAPEPAAHDVERVLVNLRDRQRIEDGLRKRCRTGATPPVESLLSGLTPSGCATCLSQVATLQEQILHSEKMEALGRMAAGMVNEFRNELTGILGFTELLIEGLEPDDSRLYLAKHILTAGQNAAALTNQLLAFGGPATIRAELLDLNESA